MEHGAPPWGEWFVIEDDPHFKVKRIEVLPGKRLSYQKHSKRDEHWYVVKGRGRVTIEGREQALEEGGCVAIGREAFHRIENIGRELLVFIEVQRGEYSEKTILCVLRTDDGRAQ